MPDAGVSPGVRRALALVFMNRYAVMAINITSTLALARLLTPAETGLFSVTASIIFLAQAIRDFGIGEFLVQERDLTPIKIRTAFGATLVIAWTIGLAVFLARGWIAAIYATPQLAHLIAIASIAFVVAPFSSTVMALLNRNLAFGTMLRISISSNLVNAAVSVTLAYLGWGASALTIGMVAMNVTTACVASLSGRSWDHIIPSLRAWREVVAFGAYMSGVNVINQIVGRAPDLIIGRALGYQSLGLYNRALGTVGLFSDLVASSVQAVVFPTFSALHRGGGDLRQPYLRVVTLTTGISLPVLAMLTITAHPLVETLLGRQWLEATPLMPIIAVGAMIDALAPMTAAVITAVGRVSAILRQTAVVRSIQVVGIAIFAQIDLHWIVIGQLGCSVIAFTVNARVLRRCLGLATGDLLRASVRSTMLAAWTVAPVAVAETWSVSQNDPAWMTLLLTYALGSMAWLLGVFALRHPFGHELLVLLRIGFGAVSRNFGNKRA